MDVSKLEIEHSLGNIDTAILHKSLQALPCSHSGCIPVLAISSGCDVAGSIFISAICSQCCFVTEPWSAFPAGIIHDACVTGTTSRLITNRQQKYSIMRFRFLVCMVTVAVDPGMASFNRGMFRTSLNPIGSLALWQILVSKIEISESSNSRSRKAGYSKKVAGTDAVTLVRRFGSVLNLSIRLHTPFLDRVYADRVDGSVRDCWVSWPTTEPSEVVRNWLKTAFYRGFTTVCY